MRRAAGLARSHPGRAAAAADAGADAPPALRDRHHLHGQLRSRTTPPGWPKSSRRHPQVERILCGHLHRAIDRRFAGTVAGTAPATAHQIRLNLVPDARISFTFEPPGYQLHLVERGQRPRHPHRRIRRRPRRRRRALSPLIAGRHPRKQAGNSTSLALGSRFRGNDNNLDGLRIASVLHAGVFGGDVLPGVVRQHRGRDDADDRAAARCRSRSAGLSGRSRTARSR